MMNIKGQLQTIRNIFFFLFVIIAVIVIAMLSVVTTPLVQGLVTDFGISGGLAVFSNHFNLIMIIILLIAALIISMQGGANT